MVRLAAQQHRFPRRYKNLLCVFLNATHGLAVLVTGGLPLAWRQFALPAGSESLAILSAARTLQTQYKHYGIESSADYAMIFGREEIHEQLRKEQLPSDMGTRMIWHDGPSLSSRATAFGLALGGLTGNESGFDLSRDLKPRPSIGEIFPWGDLAFVCALLVSMGGVLGFHYMKLSEQLLRVQAESSQYASLAAGESSHLEKDEKEVRQKIDAVRQFLEGRILWTSFTRNIANYLPNDAQLTSFEGKNILENGGKKSSDAKKSLKLRATAPLAEDGSIPREMDEFLNQLRKNEVLKRDFGSIELVDIKRTESQDKSEKQKDATFTIIGLPKK
jgi:hypothetical protein